MKHPSIRFAVLAVSVLASACTETFTPPTSVELAAAADQSPRVYVLNSQLRGIINPEIVPSPAWGHVQVKLRDEGAAGYAVEWNGKLNNPNRSVFSGGFIVDSEISPDGEIPEHGDGGEILIGGDLVFAFFRETTQSCDILDFGSAGITDEEHIPADVAQRMIAGPDLFRVVLVATDGALVTGTFGREDPTTVVGFNPQPDPPREKVTRCEA